MSTFIWATSQIIWTYNGKSSKKNNTKAFKSYEALPLVALSW